jgi:hypothetical protein
MRWAYAIFALGVSVCLVWTFNMVSGAAIGRKPHGDCYCGRHSRDRLNWHLGCVRHVLGAPGSTE